MMSFWVVPWSAVAVDPVLLGGDDVERQQPRRRRVDRHRRVHPVERDPVQQRVHVALVRHRHADLADLAARQLVVGVVAGLRRQVERDATARSGPWRGCAGTARWTRGRSNGPRTCASSRACRAPGGGGSSQPILPYPARPMRQIDVLHRGREKVIACFEIDGVLVDPGPQSCEETLLAALGGERPKALLLTHIHFDHAGAAGALVRALAGPRRLRPRARRAAHGATPSGSWPAPRGCTAARRACARPGARSSRCPRRTSSADRRRDRARLQGRLHARPRLPPRLLTCTRHRLGVRGRHGRRADPAVGPHARADAAAGHRRRGVGALADADRRLGARGPRR